MSGHEQVAVAITEVGKPARQIKRLVPSPKEGELLIRVEAAHLLPHDGFMRDRGLFVADKLPWVLAADIAGVVEQIGPSSSKFQLGDKVFGMGSVISAEPDEAGLQRYAILKTTAAAKIPDSIKIEDAVTIPLNLITSFLALFSKNFGFDFPPPWEAEGFDFDSQSLVVIGAGTNLAKLCIQLAKIVGIGRIIAIAGPSNAEELRMMGATHVVDRHGSIDSIQEQVHAITGPEGVTHIYDCFSWTFELASAILPKSKASRLIVVHRVDLEHIRRENQLCSVQFVQCSNENLGEYAAGFWRSLPQWVEEGQVLPAAWKVIGGLDDVDEINRALDDYRDATGGPQAIVKP